MAAVAAFPPCSPYGKVARLFGATARSDPGGPLSGCAPEVLNDVDAAHLGAFAGRPGILLLFRHRARWPGARNKAGASSRVGGWNDVIGDEGSSYWIRRAALGLVSQSLDGRAQSTALAGAVFHHLRPDISDPANGLAGWATELVNPRADIAALSVLVDQVAQAGRRSAIRLIELSS